MSLSFLIGLILGGVITYLVNKKLNIDNKKREHVIKVMLDNFLRLASAIKKEQNKEASESLISVIYEIQLFGNDEQIRLDKKQNTYYK
ncbi:hypothetical protein CDV26_00175 [Francisella halioticida]|uniref:Uncharacterized protein n=1 Tax=Francisella halioticida TaxID=549298 RepID=A0ABM6LWJ8_9GAMM|nr:hypothetical protein [Francisella halioticida]ASG67012.1 hypothetical protein CDV26_00175 [Francisella halioticida]